MMTVDSSFSKIINDPRLCSFFGATDSRAILPSIKGSEKKTGQRRRQSGNSSRSTIFEGGSKSGNAFMWNSKTLPVQKTQTPPLTKSQKNDIMGSNFFFPSTREFWLKTVQKLRVLGYTRVWLNTWTRIRIGLFWVGAGKWERVLL